MTDTGSLQLARTALETHDWQGAYDAFVHASVDQALSGEDLEQLAEAAWWTAQPKECIDALERAYAAYSHEGNLRRAAYVALHLAEQWSERLQSAQAAGWFQRASRLLEGQPESVEHGYLELAKAMTSSGVEDLMEHGAAMLDIGSRFNDKDLQAFGLMVQGMAHIAKAEVEQGMLHDRRSHRRGGRGRAHSARDRERLLHDDRRVPGPCGLQACRGMDRCDDPLVRAPIDQRLPRPLSGTKGRDHPPPWSVRRRRGRGSPRGAGADLVRGAADRGCGLP